MNPMMGEDLARIRHRDDIGRAQRARLAHTATVARRRPVAKASSRGGRATFRQWYPRAPGRTLATAAAFEAAAAFAWFGWGQAAPGAVISIILGVGSGVALLISVAAATVVHRLRTDPSPLKGSTAVRRFALTVGIEFGVAGIGAAALGAVGVGELDAAWVCLVIGIHFVPLGQMVPGLGLVTEAAALSIVGLVAFAATGTAIRRAPSPDWAPAHTCWVTVRLCSSRPGAATRARPTIRPAH